MVCKRRGASGPWTPVGPNSPFFTTNLSQTSWYYCAVTCSSGPSTGNSTPVQVTLTPANQCYCTPTYTFGKTDGDLIANVEIIGTTLSNNTGTAPVNPAYTYFVAPPANLTGTLQAGTSYPIQVSVGSFGSQNMAVWIDFNENGVFETPGERVGFTTTSIGAFGTATFTLTLPCNPTPGVKRMRVRDVFATAGNLIDPCANYSWGETEDYDVTINQPSAITCNATSTNANCFGAANGTASATAFGGVGTYTFNWSNGATGANVSGLAAGAYTVSVTDANGCLCTKQVTITQPPALQVVSEEIISSGGPTFYNVYQIVVTGGTLPYGITFNVTGGFANYTVLNGLVDTDGNGTPDAPGSTITVSFQNEAAWTLTLNDANGCAEGTGLVFSNASSAILAITGAAITPDNGTGNGSIALTVAGGVPTCPGYNYQWSGPSNWLGAAVNSPTLSNLPSGWYVVVVTDCSGGQTYAWYWVPKQSRGRGKLAEGESIMAYPNPVTKETTIEFSLNTTEKATIVVYGVDGKAVATLYNNVAEAGELYTIPFTVSDMAAGMYMVTLTTESGMVQHLKLSVMK